MNRRVLNWIGWAFVALTAAFLTGCHPRPAPTGGLCPCPHCCVVGR